MTDTVGNEKLGSVNAAVIEAAGKDSEKRIQGDSGGPLAEKHFLGDGAVFSADTKVSGLGNSNVLIIGGTGSGKTVTLEANIAHMSESSLLVALAKKKIRDVFIRQKTSQGYTIYFLDTTNPETGTGFDPLDYVRNDEDVAWFSEIIINRGMRQDEVAYSDKYWPDISKAAVRAFIHLEMENAYYEGRRPCLANVIRMIRDLTLSCNGRETNFDAVFAAAKKRNPGSKAAMCWGSISRGAEKTLSCTISTIRSSVENYFTDDILEICRKEERLDVRELGRKKVMLVVNSSPFSPESHAFINLIYAITMKELFLEAESKDNGRLDVPVNLIFDDFACGCRINRFEEYISIFRAAGISATILLQSESQLVSMYGRGASNTIINNCDTQLYMGGMDVETCRNVAERMNKPLHYVLNLPLGKVLIFRRGSKPIETRRYQTYSDPVYMSAMEMNAIAEKKDRKKSRKKEEKEEEKL